MLVVALPRLLAVLFELARGDAGAQSLALLLQFAAQAPLGGAGQIALFEEATIGVKTDADLVVFQTVERRRVRYILLRLLFGGIGHLRLLDREILGLRRRRGRLLN